MKQRPSFVRLAGAGLALAFLFAVSSALRAAAPQAVTRPTPAGKSPERALLDQYCVACHNQRTKTAGIAFETLDPANVAADAEIWEKAVRKLRGGMMPPPG